MTRNIFEVLLSKKFVNYISYTLFATTYVVSKIRFAEANLGFLFAPFEDKIRFKPHSVYSDSYITNTPLVFLALFFVNFLFILFLAFLNRKLRSKFTGRARYWLYSTILYTAIVYTYVFLTLEDSGGFISGGPGFPTGLPLFDIPFWLIAVLLAQMLLAIKMKIDRYFNISILLFVISLLYSATLFL